MFNVTAMQAASPTNNRFYCNYDEDIHEEMYSTRSVWKAHEGATSFSDNSHVISA